jgi:hypothetical protein
VNLQFSTTDNSSFNGVATASQGGAVGQGGAGGAGGAGGSPSGGGGQNGAAGQSGTNAGSPGYSSTINITKV